MNPGAKQFNVEDPDTVTESLTLGHISKGEGDFNIKCFYQQSSTKTDKPIPIPLKILIPIPNNKSFSIES